MAIRIEQPPPRRGRGGGRRGRGPTRMPTVVDRKAQTILEPGQGAITGPDGEDADAAPIRRRVDPEVTQRWREATAELTSRDGSPYFAHRTYAEGDVLLHKRFGVGVVEEVASDDEVRVLFRDGVELLEMNSERDVRRAAPSGRAAALQPRDFHRSVNG